MAERQIGIAWETTEGEIVITGSPTQDDQLPEEKRHNCDAMGCGQEHVLYRFPREPR